MAAHEVKPIPHLFGGHQHCLKCGKPEADPEADDCTMTGEALELYIRRGFGLFGVRHPDRIAPQALFVLDSLTDG